MVRQSRREGVFALPLTTISPGFGYFDSPLRATLESYITTKHAYLLLPTQPYAPRRRRNRQRRGHPASFRPTTMSEERRAAPPLSKEILARIFRLIPLDERPRSNDPARARPRIKTLLSAAQVCDAWTEPAQDELWRSLTFDANEYPRVFSWKKFVNRAPQTKVRETRELFLLDFGGTEVEEVLLACWGIRKLELGGMSSMGVGIFQHPSLARGSLFSSLHKRLLNELRGPRTHH